MDERINSANDTSLGLTSNFHFYRWIEYIRIIDIWNRIRMYLVVKLFSSFRHVYVTAR